jgi:O-antigen/teichoic acid export membrane protein
MTRYKKNILANFGGGAWTGLMGIVFVPLYIRFMGMEAYGLVGFFVTLQAVFGILDMGLKNTLNRELARLDGVSGSAQIARDTVRTLELPYWGVAVLIGLIIIALSPFADQWVNAETLSPATVRYSIAIIGVVIALRWPLSFYSGGLQGLQRQVLLNVINGVAATVRGLGAVLVLWLVAPTAIAFFIFQAVVSFVHTFTVAFATWHHLPRAPARPAFSREIVRNVWKFAAGVSGTTILAIILTQMDKIVLSRMLSLETFGYYTLASVVALSLFRLIHPVFTATYPRLSKLWSAGAFVELERVYHRACRLVAITAFPAAIILCVFAREVVLLWTQSTEISDRTQLIVAVLAAGTALNGAMNIPYALQLASGWTSLGLYLNAGLLLLLAPLLIVLVKLYGAIGAAMTWLILNGLYIVVGMQLMHRRLLPESKWSWYRFSLLQPAAAGVLVAISFRMLLPPPEKIVALVMYLVAASALTFLVAAYATPDGRGILREMPRKKRGGTARPGILL